jgi:hypothetical protein
MGPWMELVVLADREYELAQAGRWEDVAELSAERLRRSLALGPAPASAAPELTRLVRVQSKIDAALQFAHASAAQELAGVQRGRTAVRGYAASLAAAPSRVDSLT